MNGEPSARRFAFWTSLATHLELVVNTVSMEEAVQQQGQEQPTEVILAKIAGELAQEFELLVLTGPASYEGRAHHNATKSPIDEKSIVRTWAPELSKNNLFGRLVRLGFPRDSRHRDKV
jgi:hypothetical protein